jgi:hypothetical protein
MKAPRHRCRLRVMADYYQFYVSDPVLSGGVAPEEWSARDVDNRAMAVRGIVVICPLRNMEVPVEVGIWDEEPHTIFANWQHIVEAPLTTRGRIEIEGCLGGNMASFEMEPGEYTVRALFRGLDTLSEDGLQGRDYYEIQIWKSKCPGLRVIRRWGEE